MKKRILIIYLALSILFMSGCGSAINSLNDDEKLIYDALSRNIDLFNNPSSIQIINCSDTFPNEDEYFVSENNEYYYCNLLGSPKTSLSTDGGWTTNENYGKEKCVMIQINADNKSGGKNSVVYCLCVEGEDAGSMYQYSEVMSSFNATSITSHEAINEESVLNNKLENLNRKNHYLQLKIHATKLGYHLADENEHTNYPISEGENIDIAKLNKAIKEYLKSKGLL